MRNKILIIGVISLLLFIGMLATSGSEDQTRKEPQPMETKQIRPTPQVYIDYSNARVDNYYVIVENKEYGKEEAQSAKRRCKKPCNVWVYDDYKAYSLQREYDRMMGNLATEKATLDEWKKTNLVYVADHMVGQITFDDGEYREFPLRDSEYEKLKKNGR